MKESDDDLKYDLAFNCICYNLEKRKDLDETSKAYIDWAKEYFQYAVKSLDSVLDRKKPFFFTPHLKELIQCLGNKWNDASREDVLKAKEDLNLLLNNLDNLKKNPRGFYETKDSRDIFDFFKKFTLYFQDDFIRVFSYEDFLQN